MNGVGKRREYQNSITAPPPRRSSSSLSSSSPANRMTATTAVTMLLNAVISSGVGCIPMVWCALNSLIKVGGGPKYSVESVQIPPHADCTFRRPVSSRNLVTVTDSLEGSTVTSRSLEGRFEGDREGSRLDENRSANLHMPSGGRMCKSTRERDERGPGFAVITPGTAGVYISTVRSGNSLRTRIRGACAK
jgi:hypothetical protein